MLGHDAWKETHHHNLHLYHQFYNKIHFEFITQSTRVNKFILLFHFIQHPLIVAQSML